MAYRSDLKPRDKGGAIAAVIALHAAVLIALLNLSGGMESPVAQSVMRVFDLTNPPPPPPPPPPPQRREQPKSKQKAGGSSPKNIKSEATPVVAPKPKVVVPPVPQIAATETPRQGNAPTQGASDVRGPGTGNGAGAGGGVATPVSLVRGISARDYPDGVMRSWPRGGAIFLRLRIEPNGRPSRCDVMR